MTKFFLLVLSALASLAATAHSEDAWPRPAPPNPAFDRYLEAAAAPATFQAGQAQPGRALGWIPSPLLPVYAAPAPAGVKIAAVAAYPASYDLRTRSKLTSVKNQGACGDCWAFAAMGSMESYFLPGETLDLSEAHLDANSGFDIGSCGGGNDNMSAAYMTRWSGPVTEGSSDVVKHAQNIIFLSPRTGPADNDRIKGALMTYGAVSAAFYYGDAQYNAATYSFYANISTTMYASNHAITIVGWNDNYAAANFTAAPPGNGAFICRNSWGTAWGDAGYFYISYYDGILGRDAYATAFTGEGLTSYTGLYSYDTLGWIRDYGFGSTTGWYANIFTAAANESLKAVGFYANDVSVAYTVQVYTGVTAGQPVSGTLAYTGSGTLSSPGYYTVPVGLVALEAGQAFSVVVKAVNASYAFPVPMEAQRAGYSGMAAASGKSFISSDGITWSGMPAASGGYTPTNVNIKAYSTTQVPDGVVALKDNLFRPLRNPAVQCRVDVTLFSAGNVTIKIYTVNGGLVRTLYKGPQAAGLTSYSWDGKNDNGTVPASGLYLVHVRGPGTDRIEKAVLIK